MAKKADAIRTEYFDFPCGKIKAWIFLCKCGKEYRLFSSRIKQNQGKCKSCNTTHRNKLRPQESRYNTFKRANPETDLTYEDYIKFVGQDCVYCGRKLNWDEYTEHKNKRGQKAYWLDRIDNDKGHTKGNLVVCCGLDNCTRTNRFTFEEFLLLGPVLKQIRLQRESGVELPPSPLREEAKKLFTESAMSDTINNEACKNGMCTI